MKALTIREPYASLIKRGYKKIETRSWKTNYRGELYIHAGLSKDKIPSELQSFIKSTELKQGHIICKCKLVDCIYMDQDFIDQIKNNYQEYIMGEYKIGRYAWILEDVEEVEAISIKGKLSIWNYEKSK